MGSIGQTVPWGSFPSDSYLRHFSRIFAQYSLGVQCLISRKVLMK